MIKAFRPRRWICPTCVYRQRRIQRGLVNAAAPSPSEDVRLPLASYAAPESSRDDQILRQIFDSQPFWHEFSQRHSARLSPRPAGLFRNKYLTHPEGFQEFAAVTLQKAQKIVAKVLEASTIEEYGSMVRDLDRLSDLLCRVIDLADFVRVTHPDRKIQAAATKAYGLMFEYMNVLNTTTGLNEQLKRATANPEVWGSWSEEEKVVAQILMRDFSKSAIDLPPAERRKFVDLSSDISLLGSSFVDNMAPEKDYLTFESSRLKGMDPVLVGRLTKWGKVRLPAVGPPAGLALRTVHDAGVRREIYIANRTAARSQVQKLEGMIRRRAELAKLSGYGSFAEMALTDKMAKSPESVNKFLHALSRDNAVRVQQELSELLRLKREVSANCSASSQLNPWDRDYFISSLLTRSRSKTRAPDFLSAYFSLGIVMQGLSRLFTRLYGIRFVPRETSPGETWNDDVRRLDIVDESDGHIAVVYCDLFERAGKNPNPAHFTLRCSRLISALEIAETAHETGSLAAAEDAVNDGMAANRDPHTNELYQLPTIALICDFPRNASQDRPTLLSFRDVQTLFHEMGHAVHSILGRTSFQNVSGTRCATDFAELPSVLMEHFVSAPEVLGLFARHWETDHPLPYQMVKEKLSLDRRFAGTETEHQILLALLDQAYHSTLPLSPDFNSTHIYHSTFTPPTASLQEPKGTAWQGFFGHLFGYGATYYSYLFDRAIAGRVWKKVFGEGRESLSVERGGKFREEVLRWGGGRDGWACVAGVLGDGRLKEGGGRAMEEVGRWGVRE
ncbi:MAG: Mitochondrial intermediate peptidase [Trichoglossum hirsutum]|nr:MAG: Mitochondrial intermediate peptidase [Trichoglossum hirsutum]